MGAPPSLQARRDVAESRSCRWRGRRAPSRLPARPAWAAFRISAGLCSLGPRSELWDLCPRTRLARVWVLHRGTHITVVLGSGSGGVCPPRPPLLQGSLRASHPRPGKWVQAVSGVLQLHSSSPQWPGQSSVLVHVLFENVQLGPCFSRVGIQGSLPGLC